MMLLDDARRKWEAARDNVNAARAIERAVTEYHDDGERNPWIHSERNGAARAVRSTLKQALSDLSDLWRVVNTMSREIEQLERRKYHAAHDERIIRNIVQTLEKQHHQQKGNGASYRAEGLQIALDLLNPVIEQWKEREAADNKARATAREIPF